MSKYLTNTYLTNAHLFVHRASSLLSLSRITRSYSSSTKHLPRNKSSSVPAVVPSCRSQLSGRSPPPVFLPSPLIRAGPVASCWKSNSPSFFEEEASGESSAVTTIDREVLQPSQILLPAASVRRSSPWVFLGDLRKPA